MDKDPMYQPAWAGEALTKTDPLELILLRSFFEKWEHMHKLMNEKGSRKEQEIASMLLVDAANAVRQLKPVIIHG